MNGRLAKNIRRKVKKTGVKGADVKKLTKIIKKLTKEKAVNNG